MKSAIKNLKLNSDKTVLMFDSRFNNLNVYFRSGSNKPIRRETWRGDGWTILNMIAKQNHTTVNALVDEYSPSVFAEKVTFSWHVGDDVCMTIAS